MNRQEAACASVVCARAVRPARLRMACVLATIAALLAVGYPLWNVVVNSISDPAAIYQGKASIASINLVSKAPDQFGKAMIFPAMVETYAILALLISLLGVTSVANLPV